MQKPERKRESLLGTLSLWFSGLLSGVSFHSNLIKKAENAKKKPKYNCSLY